MRVSVLGMGAMGSRMARRLFGAGFDVVVWNRTRAACQSLQGDGARVAETPRAAALGADVVISMVRDDAAAQSVWFDDAVGAVHGLAADTVVIECSTITADQARGWGRRLAALGAHPVEAPVVGSRPQAEAGALIVLAAGERTAVTRANPVLEAFASVIRWLGPIGAGAVAKLTINGLFAGQLALMAEFIGMAEAQGVSVQAVMDAVTASPVCGPGLAVAVRGMAGPSFPPAFPIDLVAKDLGLILASAASAGVGVPVSHRVAGVYGDAREAGLGADNITGIAQMYRSAGSSTQRSHGN